MADTTITPAALLRRGKVESISGLARSTIYRRIQNKTFPAPVRLGGGIVGWPAAEIFEINKARIAGAADAEIRALVERLHADRQTQKAAA